ncbi:LysR family transcriptional regulator [Herbaspirillum autotrophicum]|uniref:LysR family transcriptional regulator n=1 Tax=Herbaspirillum autotrophicum TaxID=180195 RepID=UPI00067D4909|nr:LysR family transcriptional regulator [Herbaspirillum autotrophicum]
MDKLTAMQVFVAVVDSGSQSAASVQLDLSRPVVSRYLAELEEWVGARLLHRTTRRLSLTPAGADILERSRKMLEFAGDMQSAVHQPQQAPRGLLRITASTSFAQMQLAQVVADYGARYPEVAVDMVILDRTVNLIEDRIDLAIRITNRLDPNLIARKLSVCRSVVCASPAYLHKHPKPLRVEDLALHNCLTHSYVGKSLWQFTRDGEPSSVAVSGNISANESMVLLHAALAGAGIAFLPTYSAGPLIRSGKLVALLPEYEPSQLDIYGVYASRRHMSAALRSMLDFLAERLTLTPVWDAPA